MTDTVPGDRSERDEAHVPSFLRAAMKAPDPVVVLGASDRTIRYANEAFEAQLSTVAERFEGRPLGSVVPDALGPRFGHLIDRAVAAGDGQVPPLLVAWPRSIGADRHWQCRAWQVLGDHGEELVFLLASDVTRLQSDRERASKAADRARAANLELLSAKLAADEMAEMRADILTFVSHELRTPLTVMLGMSRLLEKRMAAHPEHDMVADIVASAEDLDRLVSSMLLLAQPDLVGEAQAEHPVRLLPLMQELIGRRRELDPGREYRLVEPSQASPLVGGEQTLIERVVVNLVANADKYSPRDRPIVVALESETDAVNVRVLDEGSGFAPEEADRLFEPFYRGGDQQAGQPGIGLGLAVCKHIVEALGGRVWARQRERGGSEFGFRLPLLEADQVAEPGSP